MNKVALSIFLLMASWHFSFAQLTVDCDATYTVPSTTYTGDVTVTVSDSIISSAIHTNSSAVVYKAANSILCIGDFEIELGTTFCAEIESCTTTTPCIINGIHAAYDEFVQRGYTVTYNSNADEVTLMTDGLPDHESPYWSTSNALYITPVCTNTGQMAPGDIDNFNGSYSLTVPQVPALATNSSSTGLGAIGFAVSGSVIYNDEEGPNIPLNNAVGSLDCNGAHTGPQSYHYHLEPVSWSQDDDELIGIISDGFFLYGRKCASTGTYPTDLDASGGHTSMTQHSCSTEYHYHIENELFLGAYYILFPGDYQGTPNNIQ